MEVKMKKIEHNVETGKITETELSLDEIAEIEENAKAIAEKQLLKNRELEAKAAQKAALLDRLGITEDEAKLLLA
jgi:non-ribosomal peptide synthetase component E (peptide arylation enzyme)